MSETARRDLVLTGPPAAGKSAAGRIAAALLGRPFADLDALVEARTGRTVAALFESGEGAFRAAERDAAAAWLERAGRREPEVLALGGGTLSDGALADAFAGRTTLVHLDASAEVLAGRLDGPARAARPLLAGESDPLATLARLRSERAPGYARAALTVETSRDDDGGAATAHRLLRALHDPPTGPWRSPPAPLDAALASARGVTIGRGAAANPVHAERVDRSFENSRPEPLPAVLLVDDGLPALHADAVRAVLAGGLLAEQRVPAGERAKTLASLDRAWSALIEARADRYTRLEVLGGGSVTDLGGLVAATFKRGVPLTLRPTTLLAQLDAALGGKNGIDVQGVKNVAGTIRLPDATHLDTLTLMTLSPRALRCGFAEAVKSAVIGDAALLDELERAAATFSGEEPLALPLLERIVERSACVKLRVVETDPEERGPRRVLNLGHTVGHALETAARAEGLDLEHGEAVAIGLVAAARLSARTGVLADRALPRRLEAILTASGLPTAVPRLGRTGRAAFDAALAHDKKARDGRIAWVLPRRAGEVVLGDVPAADVVALLAGALA